MQFAKFDLPKLLHFTFTIYVGEEAFTDAADLLNAFVSIRWVLLATLTTLLDDLALSEYGLFVSFA